MKAFAAVLRRELAERWMIPVAAALLGLVPLAAPLLPMEGYRGPDLRGGTALALALIASYLLALVLGGSVLARDLGERRLGFYFSRPLPGWAIWAGKLGTAILLALGSGLLILLPSLLLGDRPGAGALSWKAGFAANTGLWAASVTLLVLLANAAAVLVRSRSPWLLFDLGAAAVLTAWLWVQLNQLQAAGAIGAVMGIQIAMLAVLLVALAAASAVQILRARTDLRRGHRLLSLTLWGLLGGAALAAAGYGRWVLAASPEDLFTFRLVLAAPAGPWVAVSGPASGRADFQPLFLLDTRSGRYVRISASSWAYEVWAGPVFSEDGRRAVWLEPERRGMLPVSVRRLDLDRADSRPVAVPITFDRSGPRALSVSRDGRRMAVIHRQRILVMDLANGRNLASVPVPSGGELWQDRLRFLASGVLRFYGTRSSGEGETADELRVIDVDPGSGKILRAFALPARNEWPWDLSRDGNHLLLHSRDLAFTPSQVRVVDLTTGEPSISVLLQRVTGRVDLLDDDRLMVSERAGGKMVLRLLDLRGAELRRFEIPAARARIAGRPAPGLLVVSVMPPGRPGDWASRQNLLLDLDRGTWKPFVNGVVPAAWTHLPPGSLGTRLFFDNDGGLFEVDLKTGRRRVILHPEER